MKPAAKITARSHVPGRRTKRRRVPVLQHAVPMDRRAKVFIVSSAFGFLVVAGMTYAGMRDARVLSTGMFFAVIGPMCLTALHLKSYLPRASQVRKRELLNIPAGIPLGVGVFYVWKIFPAMYTAVEDVVWRPSEVAGGAYLEGMQIALDTAGGYFLGLILGALLVSLQAAVWVLPAYFLSKAIAKPVEDQVEDFYHQKIRQSTRQVVGRPSRLTKFKVGGELAETKVQLRMYGTMLCLFSGLVTILILAWVTPLR